MLASFSLACMERMWRRLKFQKAYACLDVSCQVSYFHLNWEWKLHVSVVFNINTTIMEMFPIIIILVCNVELDITYILYMQKKGTWAIKIWVYGDWCLPSNNERNASFFMCEIRQGWHFMHYQIHTMNRPLHFISPHIYYFITKIGENLKITSKLSRVFGNRPTS